MKILHSHARIKNTPSIVKHIHCTNCFSVFIREYIKLSAHNLRNGHAVVSYSPLRSHICLTVLKEPNVLQWKFNDSYDVKQQAKMARSNRDYI